MAREKVILQDFNVLLVCTSKKWSTIERRILFDGIFLRDIGCNPVLLCLEGSQLDIESEKEDIEKIYLSNHRFHFTYDVKFFAELYRLLSQNRFDVVHCYSLMSTWMTSLILKRNKRIPLLFTLNQNINSIYHHFVAKWLLKRVDYVFTLSDEIQDFVGEAFNIQSYKIKNLGGGIDLNSVQPSQAKPRVIGCVINSMSELVRLKGVVKIFRVLQNHSSERYEGVILNIFLGPWIYQKDRAKKVLTELDYEFYEGDVFLYQLENKMDEFRSIDPGHVVQGQSRNRRSRHWSEYSLYFGHKSFV